LKAEQQVQRRKQVSWQADVRVIKRGRVVATKGGGWVG